MKEPQKLFHTHSSIFRRHMSHNTITINIKRIKVTLFTGSCVNNLKIFERNLSENGRKTPYEPQLDELPKIFDWVSRDTPTGLKK